MIPSRGRIAAAAVCGLLLALLPAHAQKTKSASEEADQAAIRRVLSDFTETFNKHDVQGSVMLFAENADMTNMYGASHHGRKEIEQLFQRLYSGPLQNAQRTDTVKEVRLLSPRLAELDADWEMTGAKAANGAVVPVRKGLTDWVLEKQNGRWQIVVFHEAEFPR